MKKRPAAALGIADDVTTVACVKGGQDTEKPGLRDRMKARRFDAMYAAGNLPQHVLDRIKEIDEGAADETGHACTRNE